MSFSHSNQFLPLGKARMGYPSGEARWGLMAIGGVILKLNAQPVYLGLSLVCFGEVVT